MLCCIEMAARKTSGLASKPSCATATLLEEKGLRPDSGFASHGLLELSLQNETLYKCRVQLDPAEDTDLDNDM